VEAVKAAAAADTVLQVVGAIRAAAAKVAAAGTKAVLVAVATKAAVRAAVTTIWMMTSRFDGAVLSGPI
jgi:hypothetical protein